MKNIKRLFFYILIFTLQNSFSQEIIRGNIIIDKYGKMIIKEEIDNYFISDTLLLHKNIPLHKNNEEVLINRQNIFRNKYVQYKNTDGIVNFSVSPPKSSYDNYFFSDDVFFISENYLALSKRTFNTKKRFDLNIFLPQGIKLIYPTEESLLKEVYKAPPIIAGNFDEKFYNGYCVYTQSKIKNKEERIKYIISVINKTFTHFQTIFSNKHKRPEIIFLPFQGKLAGKNISNLIILNESFLNDKWLNKKSLIHETLHLWWGDNSIRFENPVLTEAITEFFTLDYLKKIKEYDYLERQISFKKRTIRDVKTYNLDFNQIDNKATYNIYCYSLLPLLMWSNNTKINIKEVLVNFYINNANSFVDVSTGNNLLYKMGIPLFN